MTTFVMVHGAYQGGWSWKPVATRLRAQGHVAHASASVVSCTQAVNPPEAHQRRTAQKLGASYDELDTGHYPMLSAPDELTKLLLG